MPLQYINTISKQVLYSNSAVIFLHSHSGNEALGLDQAEEIINDVISRNWFWEETVSICSVWKCKSEKTGDSCSEILPAHLVRGEKQLLFLLMTFPSGILLYNEGINLASTSSAVKDLESSLKALSWTEELVGTPHPLTLKITLAEGSVWVSEG